MIRYFRERAPILQHVLVLALSLGALYLTSLSSYLLFHSLAELFRLVVAFSIFIVGWASRRSFNNDYLLFLGISFLFIAGIDSLHTLAYKGMGIFPGSSSNLPTQLWVAARYLQSLSLLIAPLFFRRSIKSEWIFAGCALVAAGLVGAIFGGVFPVCYVDGVGLTPFKIASEYVISAILLGAIVLLARNRSKFDPQVLRWLDIAIIASIMSEIAFTSYVSVFGVANLLGHLLKIVAFYGFFQAIVQTGFYHPLDLLLRDLKQNEIALHRAQVDLERRVEERTRQLARSNAELRSEIGERQRIQAELAEVQSRLMDSQEAERLRLARDLHDGPIQNLIAATFQLQLRREELDLDSADALGSIQELVSQVSQELREICGQLRPQVLAPFGLEKAIRSYAGSFHQDHPEIDLRMDLWPDGKELPEATRLALFRICQQALNNIAQHAQATRVWIRFGQDPEKIWLEIKDDGQGFEVPQGWIQLVRAGHLGIAGMSERAEAIGGKYQVCSAPGNGTRIQVKIPREMIKDYTAV
jgi:signal transduction histidine kinase